MFLLILGKLAYCILISIFYSILNTIKFFIPYKCRAKSINGEIVLVTGAASGLGKSLAKKLAQLDATLVLWDIDEVNNNKTCVEINASGGRAFAFKCDLSDRNSIYKVSDEVKRQVGQVTILVNNAGIVTGKKFMESDDRLIEKTMQVNTLAHFWTTKAFLPSMLEKNHGHIVSLASMAGHVGSAGLCDYSASKFGAVGFDESLRNELIASGRDGVKTTAVCPYYINTGMFDGVHSSLIPLLETEYVTDKIVEAMLTDQEILMLPRLMYLFVFLKWFLPNEAIQYLTHYVFDTHKCMDKFVGRKKSD